LAINGPWLLDHAASLTAITPLDENLKTQFQDEIVIGGEYQFGGYWSAGARYVHRQLSRIIEDIGTFTDPADPILLTGYVIGNPGEGFFGAPFDKPVRDYDALELTLQRRLHQNWQLYTSFVWARAKGNHEGLCQACDQLDPNINARTTFRRSSRTRSARCVRTSRPVQGARVVHVRLGPDLSEAFVLSSGVPISAQGPEIYNGYGDGVIFLLPRGSEGRTDL
jgi:hypothetical protein